MKIINNKKLLNNYITKYQINDILSNKILPYTELHFYEKGECIFLAEHQLVFYYFLVDGKIKVFSLLENGKSLLLAFYNNFVTLGDVELLKNTPILNNVEVVENSYLIGIPANILREDCYNNNNFLKFMINSLSTKMQANNINNSYNLLYPLINRLSSYLLEHHNPNNKYIVLSSSFKDISDFLGTSYRHLNRTLNELEKLDIIRCEGKKIYILNIRKLEELAKNLYR